MKKIILIGILLSLIPGIRLMAVESQIKSRGSIEGIVSLYAADMRYLESEIAQLLEECKEESYE